MNEIERVDVMYGPFSALYPGNSMGGVVTLTTRMPDRLEAHVDLKGGIEDFGLYGTGERNSQFDGSAAIGDRIGDFSFWVDFDHLDAYGHPLSFATAKLSTKPAARGATPVAGALPRPRPERRAAPHLRRLQHRPHAAGHGHWSSSPMISPQARGSPTR